MPGEAMVKVAFVAVVSVVSIGLSLIVGRTILKWRRGTRKRLRCQLDAPFRPNQAGEWSRMARENLRNVVLEAKPHPNCGFDLYNLLIVGPLQAGKSSFKNTIKSIFAREICYQQATGRDPRSVTRKFTIGPVRDRDGKSLGHFRFADMPGLEDVINTVNTIGGILDGRIKHNSVFRDGVDPPFDAEPNENNRIHCVVMIIDGMKTAMDKDLRSILIEVGKLTREKGILVVVVLTHLDEICNCVLEDLSKTFTCEKVRDVMASIDFLGIDQGHIFVVQNYCQSNNRIDEKLECLCLETLKHLLQCCREYGDTRLDDHDND